jgi:hypothetical protein
VASAAEEEAQGRLMQTAHVFSDVSEGYVDQGKPAARLRLSGSRSGFPWPKHGGLTSTTPLVWHRHRPQNFAPRS